VRQGPSRPESPVQQRAQDLVIPETILNSLSLLSGERSELAAEVLRRSGGLRLQVRGESMLPTIWPRAIVEIVSCSVCDVKRGEIVLAMRDGRLFLHRFVGCEEGGFTLQGDSTPRPDPVFENGALIGKLVNGYGARASSVFPVRLLCRAMGRLFCDCGPVRRVALSLHRRWDQWREEQRAAVGRTVHLEAEW
jgi:Peptidase S24-like